MNIDGLILRLMELDRGLPELLEMFMEPCANCTCGLESVDRSTSTADIAQTFRKRAAYCSRAIDDVLVQVISNPEVRAAAGLRAASHRNGKQRTSNAELLGKRDIA